MGKINAHSPINPLHEDILLELEVLLEHLVSQGAVDRDATCLKYRVALHDGLFNLIGCIFRLSDLNYASLLQADYGGLSTIFPLGLK
jgi:hypothetical protein